MSRPWPSGGTAEEIVALVRSFQTDRPPIGAANLAANGSCIGPCGLFRLARMKRPIRRELHGRVAT